jgi:hypothetical protein
MIIMVDKSKIAAAINLLIECDRFAKYVNEMTAILEDWDQHPMAYAGKLAPLNELLRVGLESRVGFERLIALAEERRKQLPKQRRTDYQRELMAQRRTRVAKAIELQELLHGKMDAAAKEKYAKEIQARWATAKEKFLASQGELTWDQKNKKSQEFWAAIDGKLDANIAHEREKKRNL